MENFNNVARYVKANGVSAPVKREIESRVEKQPELIQPVRTGFTINKTVLFLALAVVSFAILLVYNILTFGIH